MEFVSCLSRGSSDGVLGNVSGGRGREGRGCGVEWEPLPKDPGFYKLVIGCLSVLQEGEGICHRDLFPALRGTEQSASSSHCCCFLGDFSAK